jgi:hypothetical protein
MEITIHIPNTLIVSYTVDNQNQCGGEGDTPTCGQAFDDDGWNVILRKS